MFSPVFYIITIGLVSGVFLRSFLYVPLPVILLFTLISIGLLLVWWRRHDGGVIAWYSFCVSTICISITLGMLRYALVENATNAIIDQVHSTSTATIEGVVIREPEKRDSTLLVTVSTATTTVLVRTDRYAQVQYGDTVTLTGKLAIPEAFTTDVGREFDYRSYLLARGVTHTMTYPQIIIVSRDTESLPARLLAAKTWFIDRLAQVIPEPAFGLGVGLLLGVKSSLGETLEEVFRTAGITHIVVLSGYNMMLIVAFILVVCAWLPWRLRLITAIGAIGTFTFLVGYSPSVMRASIMAVLFLLSTLLARPYLAVRMLVLAGAVMVIWNPYIIRYDLGFQLSFMATLGLVVIAPQFELLFRRVTIRFSIRTFLIATVATQIAVAPLLLYYIGEWSLIAIPINLLVLPMVPVAMLGTFITGLVAICVPPLVLPIAFWATVSLEYIIATAELGAAVPFATVSIPPFSGYIVIVSYALLGILWYYWHVPESPRHLSVTTPRIVPVSGWVIVEEEIVERQTKQKADPTRQESALPREESLPPVFFR